MKTLKIIEHTTFKVLNYQNVEAIVMALVMSGYHIKVNKEYDGTGSGYEIIVYKSI